MKTQALTVILLRVLAVFVISQELLYVSQFFSFAYQAPNVSGNVTLGILIAAVAPLAMGFIIWALAPHIAALGVRKLPPSIEMGGLTAEGLVYAAFVVIGVWLIVTALPPLIAIAFRGSEPEASNHTSWVVGRVLECLFGIGLIMGSRTLSSVLLRLRYAGTSG